MRDAGMDLADLSAGALARGYRAGAFDPVDALDACLARIAARDGGIGAFVHLDPVASRAQAEAAATRLKDGAARGPLDGVPVSVKDLTPVAGWPNRRGSLALADAPPASEDASAMARLREAGAVFLGKTATPEHGTRIVTSSALHGVTRHPLDPRLTPGGSSGGAAAALAAGMGPLATGTDGAGSIRIPAAFCGVWGLKPGFGRVPAFPPSHFMPHAVTGPMARTAADLATMAEAMARPDPRDPFAWPVPFDAEATRAPLAGLRVALSADLGTGRPPDLAIAAALTRIADRLSDLGARVEMATPAWPVDPALPFDVFWTTSYAGFLDLHPPEAVAKMTPLIREIAGRGRAVDTAAYHRALNDRLAITAEAHRFLTRFDAVLGPSVGGPAFPAEAEAPPGERPDDWAWSPWCYLFNMTGQPALAVPAGLDAQGLPLGVQIAARAGREEMLLALARGLDGPGAPDAYPPGHGAVA
jgi:aspartyl-tRNA(Asn)/glutamyl-tRNA(Gln) amidotransferase subunit A